MGFNSVFKGLRTSTFSVLHLYSEHHHGLLDISLCLLEPQEAE